MSLKDASFDEQDFEILHGLLEVSWDKIPAYPLLCLYVYLYSTLRVIILTGTISNNNVTHTVIAKPKFAGTHNMSYAEVNYSDESENYVSK